VENAAVLHMSHRNVFVDEDELPSARLAPAIGGARCEENVAPPLRHFAPETTASFSFSSSPPLFPLPPLLSLLTQFLLPFHFSRARVVAALHLVRGVTCSGTQSIPLKKKKRKADVCRPSSPPTFFSPSFFFIFIL
jgi:hypothetical protein